MIENMKFLSITGPKDDIDRIIEKYISKYDIQLENALLELKNVYGLHTFTQNNPYKTALDISENLKSRLQDTTLPNSKEILYHHASDIILNIEAELSTLQEQRESLLSQITELQERLSKVEQFIGLNYDLDNILHFKFIKFRFGRIEKEYYEKFLNYVYDGIDSVFCVAKEVEGYIWGVYFVPDTIAEKVDAIYSSLHFERFYLPDYYHGTPMEASKLLQEKIQKESEKLAEIDAKITTRLEQSKEEILLSNQSLKRFNTNFDIRKMAACTREDKAEFYIICGWMTQRDADRFQIEIGADPNVYYIIEPDHSNLLSKPPTKLRNFSLFKPFELFVEMYGLPDYKEFDPTILIALSYSILFGFMFGDVGQGLCLLIGGLLLEHFKKSRLAGIIGRCGFFSIIFGFMFGSFFGFEDILPAIWLHPSKAMTHLPIIGKLNTVFVVAILIGMFCILSMMILNIIGRLREKKRGEAFFDTNGIAGLIFYASSITIIILMMLGKTIAGGIVLIFMFVIPLCIIFFKEPLTHLLEKKTEVLPKEMGMFIMQGFFELFEVLLSYFSNTLSFVRVGAFAISHSAMMEVVLMLSGAESGQINWIVIVLGNLFVCGMEGLIVGIQVLRLEYYELFSRFYKGTGRAFMPYGKE